MLVIVRIVSQAIGLVCFVFFSGLVQLAQAQGTTTPPVTAENVPTPLPGFYPTQTRSPLAPLSIKAFVDEPDVFDIALSPDGKSFVVARTRWESEATQLWDEIRIASVNQPTKITRTIDRDDLKINWVLWPKSDRIVASVIGIQRGRRSYTLSDQLISIDPETGIEKVLLSRPLSVRNRRYRVAQLVNINGNSVGGTSSDVLIAMPRGSATDLVKLNIYTGAQQVLETGNAKTCYWITDNEDVPSVRVDYDSSTSVTSYHSRQGTVWKEIARVLPEQSFSFDIIAHGEDPGTVYVLSLRDGEERRAIWLYDLRRSVYIRKVAEHERFDLEGGLVRGRPRRFVGAQHVDDALKYVMIDPAQQSLVDVLQAKLGNDLRWQLFDSDSSGDAWLIVTTGPRDSGTYWLFQTKTEELTQLTRIRDDLPSEVLAPMDKFVWRASDGLELSGYITRRPSNGPMPLLVMPHGGPEARDSLSFDAWGQFFASRGYAVFQPNFRGSDGFGRSFREAGFREWGNKMRTDIEDGVDALIAQRIANPANMVIVGASYGGYAALNAVTQPNNRYLCAASINGVTDLSRFVDFQLTRPANESGTLLYEHWRQRIGDPKTDLAALNAASPAVQIQNLKVPTLLLHANEDKVVPYGQAQMMFGAARGNPLLQFKTIEGEGHSNWEEETEVRALSDVSYFLTTCMIHWESNPKPNPLLK